MNSEDCEKANGIATNIETTKYFMNYTHSAGKTKQKTNDKLSYVNTRIFSYQFHCASKISSNCGNQLESNSEGNLHNYINRAKRYYILNSMASELSDKNIVKISRKLLQHK